jgi:hypothetical protein
MSPAAQNGSSRIYFGRGDAYSFRHAAWKSLSFVPSGPGRGCDEDGEPNGIVYPESEY